MAYEVNGYRPSGLVETIARVGMDVARRPSRMLRLREFKAPEAEATDTIYLSNPEHADRLIYEAVASTPSQEMHREIAAMVRELAQDRDWIMLGELLEEWDQTRAHCPINSRFVHTAISEIIESFQTEGRAPSDGAPVTQSRLPDAVAAEVETEARQNPELYTLRALAAQMRISQAWDYRGEQRLDRISDRGRQKLERASARAMEMTSNLDAKALNAPLVSMVRFNILPFRHDAGRRIMEEFKDWVCLDPGDLAPHVRMGTFLLPRWFGSHELIAQTALEAVTWTEHEIGSAAYAVIFASALRADPKATMFVDPGYSTDGVEDLVNLRGRDPSFVPYIAQELWRFGHREPLAGLAGPQQMHWSGITEHFRELSLAVVRRHMTAIHADCWRGGLTEALDYVSLAAQDTLAAGDNLLMNQRGITRTSAPEML